MFDDWSIKEKLALASSVVRSGNQNWSTVSKLVRPFASQARPSDWFSQTNCARQYSELLKLVEGPRRKRGEGEGENNPSEIIVRKLTSERIDELKKIISDHAEKYRLIKEELEEIKAGKYEGEMKEKWLILQANKKQNEESASAILKEASEAREKAKLSTLKPSRMSRTSLSENQKYVITNPELPKEVQASDEPVSSIKIIESQDDKIVEVKKISPLKISTVNLNIVPKNTSPIKLISQTQSIAEKVSQNTPISPKFIENSSPKSISLQGKLSPLKITIGIKGGETTENSSTQVSTDKYEDTASGSPQESVLDIITNLGTTTKVSIDKDIETVSVASPKISVDSECVSDEPTPLKLSPIKILRDLTSPDISASGSTFKIFQKDIQESLLKKESIQLETENNPASEDVQIATNQNSEDKDEKVGTASAGIIDDDKFFSGNTSDDPTSNDDNIEINEENINLEKSDGNVVEDVLSKDEISDEETKIKSEYSDAAADKYSEYENVNVKLKFDAIESLPGSPASISNSDTEDERLHKIWKKSIMLVWRAIANHKFANVFLHPVTEDIAPGYHSIVLRPMDLITIRKNIDIGIIRNTSEFQRDVMLMFVNAIMYNNSNQHVHAMAKTMFHDSMIQIEQFVSTQMMVQTEPKLLRTLRRSDVTEKVEDESRKRRTIDSDSTASSKKKKVPTATLR